MGRGIANGTVSDMDVATEPTWMCLWRVPGVTPGPAPHGLRFSSTFLSVCV
jgi:hypothetical protein